VTSLDPIDAAIEAGDLHVRWSGEFWVWCCRRHTEEACWIGDNPADDPAGREELSVHLAAHAAFDNQPREKARTAILAAFMQPRFWNDIDRAGAAIEAAAPILIQAGREAAARDIEAYGEGMEYGGIRAHWKKAAQIARGDASREEPTRDLRLGADR
jgi:hypothetical protein